MAMNQYSPGLEGIISNITTLSYLDVDRKEILIRGYDLIQLADKLSYTDVAHLLVHGEIPNQDEANTFCNSLRNQSSLPDELYQTFKLMPKGTMVMDALRSGISFLAGYEGEDTLMDNSHEANLEKGINLLAQVPAIAVNSYRALNGLDFVKPDPDLNYAENFLFMIRGEKPDRESLDVFDKILTCYIEHEMAASTFTTRVIASSLSDIYGAMVGAVASLKGPLHGGANEAAINMLLEILNNGGAANAENHLMQKLESRERIMGFGHRVYMREYDPRALFLRDYIPLLIGRRPDGQELHEIYRIVEQVMLRERGFYPNADYPIALLFYLLDVPIDLDTPIFFSSRVAGLIGHVMEQHEDNRLFRPRVQYDGPRGLQPPSGPISPM